MNHGIFDDCYAKEATARSQTDLIRNAGRNIANHCIFARIPKRKSFSAYVEVKRLELVKPKKNSLAHHGFTCLA